MLLRFVTIGNRARYRLAVQLPEWQYPAVCELSTGQVHYDNFNGNWGEQRHLDAFLQAYAVERAKAEARRQGHSVTSSSSTTARSS